MAAALPSSPSSSEKTYRRSKENHRSRPNLSRVCQKTKMCSFFLRGVCKRADCCSFAHDESEIQTKPDLSCTKLCPTLLSAGICPHMDHCTYAHSDAELRMLDTQGSADDGLATSFDASIEHLGSARPTATRKASQTAPLVVSRLNDAATSGALTLGGMVFHLTRIFVAVYEARPEIADRVGVPADALASATAEQVWADAGLDAGSLLSFEDLSRWAALPSELIPRHVPSCLPLANPAAKALQAQVHIDNGGSSKASLAGDSDACSQCSTDDCSSDASSGTPTRTSMGWQTPTSFCESLEETHHKPEMKVLNTFIHFSIPFCATKTRRARSLPSHYGHAGY